jgi:hypothetical protein
VLLHTTSIANIFILSIPLSGRSSQPPKTNFEKPKILVRMKSKTFTPMGSLHPILFFAGLYAVALLFSIFICSSLFYSCNARSASPGSEKITAVKKPVTSATAVAFR